MPARKKVNARVYKELKKAYDSKFGSSATHLVRAIDTVVDMDKKARRGQHVLSERAIHTFFTAAEDSTRQFNLTTLNYLAQGLLGVSDYEQAVLKYQNSVDNTSEVVIVPSKPQQPTARNTEDLLRAHRQRNLDRYSEVKSYKMYAPMSITDIYVDLNVLEREQKRMLLRSSLATKNKGANASTQQEEVEIERSEAGFLIVESNLSVLDALANYQRLMLWGRLGAGKTTTLRHILTSENLKKHGIYLELRKVFNEAQGSILDCIFDDFKVTNKSEKALLETLLKKGEFTLFLDGLDEVKTEDFRDVCSQIESFVEQYENNQIIITCRYGVYDYGFKRFTEVEACRLTLTKMERYIHQWHQTQRQKVTASSAREKEVVETLNRREQELIQALREDDSIRRLASTPLILSLICITLESGRGIPKNMYALCDDAFITSIELWDQHRHINRNSTKLSKLKKIDFLGKIGFDGMNRDVKKTTWKLHELTEMIAEVIKKLPSYAADTIEEDSRKEIKALEGYHSLLKQDINGVYSFDSPIYQYFASANYIVRQEDFDLVKNIINTRLLDRQWKDTLLMVAERRSSADKFLKNIFRRINELAQPLMIQKVLSWVYETSNASEVGTNSYRAGMIAIDMEINFFLSRYSVDDETRRVAHALARNLRELNRRYGTIVKSQNPFNIRLKLACLYTLAEDYAITSDISLKRPSDFASSYLSLLKDENFSFRRVLQEQSEVAEKLGMKSLEAELIKLSGDLPSEEKPDKEQWHAWSERLQAALNKHLNVGYSVSLSEEDETNLKDYLYATNLLAECLLVDASVELDTRQLLRHSLLLPKESVPEELANYH